MRSPHFITAGSPCCTFKEMFSQWNTNVRPCSDDDDYDIDFYTADQNTQEATDPTAPSPREQLEVRFRVVLRKLTLTSFSVFGW